ncbi:hypothetical protein CASFOL_037070 [Castilleja foliolosa]|uniref:Uncharacterized protein n=1 Tax=Castilleja foliolosa TaxID=1961234 RepID=A0ABD3BPU9_9LAMI
MSMLGGCPVDESEGGGDQTEWQKTSGGVNEVSMMANF